MFGEESIEELAPGMQFSEAHLPTAREPWAAEMNKLAPAFLATRNMILSAATHLGSWAETVMLFYQRGALQARKPFLTAAAAENPEWLDDAALKALSEPAGADADKVFHALRLWQGTVLPEAIRWCRANGLGRFLPTLWMCGSAGQPDQATVHGLFEVALGVFRARWRSGVTLEAGPTASEVANGFSLHPDHPQLAWCWTSVRAYADAVNTALGAQRQVGRVPLFGFGSDAFSSDYYAGGGIKEALMTAQYGKYRSVLSGRSDETQPCR